MRQTPPRQPYPVPQRNCQREFGPLAHNTLHSEAGSHACSEVLRYGEPQSQAAATDRVCIRGIEQIENPGLLLAADSGTVIADTHPEHVVGKLPAGSIERNVDSALSELAGIVEDMVCDFRKTVAVNPHRHRLPGQREVYLNVPARGSIAHRVHRRGKQFACIDRFYERKGIFTGLGIFETQYLVHQHTQSFAVLADDIDILT